MKFRFVLRTYRNIHTLFLQRLTKLLNCLSLSRCSSEKNPDFKALRGVWGRFLESVPRISRPHTKEVKHMATKPKKAVAVALPTDANEKKKALDNINRLC